MTTPRNDSFVSPASFTTDPSVPPRLDALRREWDGSYVIWYQDHLFCAMRRDDGALCRRAAASDLLTEIEADYRIKPVLV